MLSFAPWSLALLLCYTVLLGSTEHSAGKAMGPQSICHHCTAHGLHKCGEVVQMHMHDRQRVNVRVHSSHRAQLALSITFFSSSKTRNSFTVFALKLKQIIIQAKIVLRKKFDFFSLTCSCLYKIKYQVQISVIILAISLLKYIEIVDFT